jgi:hypothetical protein
MINIPNFVLFVLLYLEIYAACANFPSAKSKRAGFKPAPTNPDSFLRPLRSLRPFFNSVAAVPRYVLRGDDIFTVNPVEPF